MNVKEFLSLDYRDQLHLINRSGQLKESFVVGDYQVSLYKVKGFYVELKRHLRELFFEKITAMEYDDLPHQYK